MILELWDLLDRNRNKIDKTHERGKPLPEGYYHLLVYIIVQNDKGEILLSKRHQNKVFGNLWECTGGSALAGEDSLQAALREVKEEVGLDLASIDGKIIFQETRENPPAHFDYWLFQANAAIEDLTFQNDEVIDAKWVTREAFEKMVKKKEVVPTAVNYFQLIEQYFKNEIDSVIE